jgi:hypothetical protein
MFHACIANTNGIEEARNYNTRYNMGQIRLVSTHDASLGMEKLLRGAQKRWWMARVEKDRS